MLLNPHYPSLIIAAEPFCVHHGRIFRSKRTIHGDLTGKHDSIAISSGISIGPCVVRDALVRRVIGPMARRFALLGSLLDFGRGHVRLSLVAWMSNCNCKWRSSLSLEGYRYVRRHRLTRFVRSLWGPCRCQRHGDCRTLPPISWKWYGESSSIREELSRPKMFLV